LSVIESVPTQSIQIRASTRRGGPVIVPQPAAALKPVADVALEGLAVDRVADRRAAQRRDQTAAPALGAEGVAGELRGADRRFLVAQLVGQRARHLDDRRHVGATRAADADGRHGDTRKSSR